MKIALIVPANLKFSPYVKYYTTILDRERIQYETIVWDKRNIQENADSVFEFHTSDFDRIRTLIGHILFSKHCKRYIKAEGFDKIIFFTIAPVFFCGTRFVKKNKLSYLIDIRDDSPFRRFFPNRFKRLCNCAEKIVISSPFYNKWTERKATICHNVDMNLLNKYSAIKLRKEYRTPIVITFAGMMIEQNMNMRVLAQLGNNDEYKLRFVGRINKGKEELQAYVKNNSISNVVFEGEYKKEEIIEVYNKETDLINIFRDNTAINKYALPNKLYDAVLSGNPVVVFEHNEAIANYVQEYNLGLIIKHNEEDILGEVIKAKLQAFDYYKFANGRKAFLEKVKSDLTIFERTIIGFLD